MKFFSCSEKDNYHVALSLSILTGKPISLPLAHSKDEKLHLVRFLAAVSPGSIYKVMDEFLNFTPGALKGGALSLETLSIPNVIASLAILGPFFHNPISLSISGITDDNDNSLDTIKLVYATVYRAFNISTFSLLINRHGFGPSGGGAAQIKLGTMASLSCVAFRDSEIFSQISGLTITSRVSAEATHRMVENTKKTLGALGNIKIATIVCNRNDSGPSPGHNCSLYAAGKNGIFYSTAGGKGTPEETSEYACEQLLRSIKKGGVFDSKLNPLLFTFMALARGVSYVAVGEPDEEDKGLLEMLRGFLGIQYYLRPEGDGFMLKVVGVGFRNPTKI